MKKFILIAAGTFIMQCAQGQATIDRSKKPNPGPAPELKITPPATYKLPNGMTILVVEDHRLPKVSANLQIDAGPVKEGRKTGADGLMGAMLNEGIQTMSKAEFDLAVEKIGAQVSLSASGGEAAALTRYFKTAFGLMGQALQEPAFTQEAFDKLKTRLITSLKSDAKNPGIIAGRVDNALAYGKDHPYGEFETEEGIQALTLQDIKDAYQRRISPSRAYLTFIGDIKPAEAKHLAMIVFGRWRGMLLTLPHLPEIANPARAEIDVVNVPSAVQSEINVINLVDLKMSSPDYFAALLANYILGGGAESRLFMNLREKHGFTYGAYSSMGYGRFQALFNASASVRTPKTDSAVTEILRELKRINTEKVTDEELNNAKALYNGSFALGLEDPARMATLTSNILINNLPADYYNTYLQKINAVTIDDILHAAQKYINYENTRVIIVGNSGQFIDRLKSAGPPVKLYDDFANPAVEIAQ